MSSSGERASRTNVSPETREDKQSGREALLVLPERDQELLRSFMAQIQEAIAATARARATYEQAAQNYDRVLRHLQPEGCELGKDGVVFNPGEMTFYRQREEA